MPNPQKPLRVELAIRGVHVVQWMEHCLGLAGDATTGPLLAAGRMEVPALAWDVGRALSLLFCPGLGCCSAVEEHVAVFVTMHLAHTLALGRPHDWEWEKILLLVLLDTAGIAEVFQRDHTLGFDLLDAAGLGRFGQCPPVTNWIAGVTPAFPPACGVPGRFARRTSAPRRCEPVRLRLNMYLARCLEALEAWAWGRFWAADSPPRRLMPALGHSFWPADQHLLECPRHLNLLRPEECHQCLLVRAVLGKEGRFPLGSYTDPAGYDAWVVRAGESAPRGEPLSEFGLAVCSREESPPPRTGDEASGEPAAAASPALRSRSARGRGLGLVPPPRRAPLHSPPADQGMAEPAQRAARIQYGDPHPLPVGWACALDESRTQFYYWRFDDPSDVTWTRPA